METEPTVNGSTHQWEEGDFAVVLRYMTKDSSSLWAVQEMQATLQKDGLLRWADKRLLHQGSGISYREACQLCLEFAKKVNGRVPVFETSHEKPDEIRHMQAGSDGTMLIAQWRHGQFVRNRKNTILKTLKEQ